VKVIKNAALGELNTNLDLSVHWVCPVCGEMGASVNRFGPEPISGSAFTLDMVCDNKHIYRVKWEIRAECVSFAMIDQNTGRVGQEIRNDRIG
jgi:hypothetical protein